jgi:hypothetical protein
MLLHLITAWLLCSVRPKPAALRLLPRPLPVAEP